MMRNFFVTLTLICVSSFSYGQTDPKAYFATIKVADSLYEANNFKLAASKYSEAFKVNGWKGQLDDRYNAAKAWSQAKVADSAFSQLNIVVNKAKYNDVEKLSNEKAFTSLYKDPRWDKILENTKQNKSTAEAKLNMPLIEELNTIYDDDQKYRAQYDEVLQKFGRQSPEMQTLVKNMNTTDESNLVKVKNILDKYGWLGPDIIGNKGNSALFAVIQHSDLQTQEKYLPMMQDAVKKGNAKAQSLALLEDRVALRQGKKQIYGSQIGINPKTNEYYVSPLQDPDNVDKRRASVGLEPLANYLKNWNLTWDVEAYKKSLPILEQLNKN